MRQAFLICAVLALAACGANAPITDMTGRRALPQDITTLPPMKRFAAPRVTRPARDNTQIARDFLSLAFRMESGKQLPVFTRFEGPVTVRVTGTPPRTLSADLTALITRLRREAGIDITRVTADTPANITIEAMPRTRLQRLVPQAACFVVPRVTSWAEFRRNRRSARTDWTKLRTRRQVAIFVPSDVSPQEVRDCLHEETAQALGPLNDLYRLPDSIFNDDNFHTVLTGFDMLILRAFYAPELRSGMTIEQVRARLPGLLARLNPGGQRAASAPPPPTPRAWVRGVEAALGPRTAPSLRRSAARITLAIARSEGWDDDARLAFSLYILGRLSLADAPDTALAAFLEAGLIYHNSPSTRLHEAHVAVQLSAFALAAGDGEAALSLINSSLPTVTAAQNAALLATLLMMKAEALELVGRASEARAVRLDSLGWARYGFGPDREVLARLSEIAALTPGQ